MPSWEAKGTVQVRKPSCRDIIAILLDPSHRSKENVVPLTLSANMWVVSGLGVGFQTREQGPLR